MHLRTWNQENRYRTQEGKERGAEIPLRFMREDVHGKGEHGSLLLEVLSGTYQKNALDADRRDDNPADLTSVEGIPSDRRSLPQEVQGSDKSLKPPFYGLERLG